MCLGDSHLRVINVKKELQRKLEEVKELNRQAEESKNAMKQAPNPSSNIPGSNQKESGKMN